MAGRPDQKYRGVTIAPADEPLIEKLRAEHQKILRTVGTYDQIAAALNIPRGTVRSRLHRARAALLHLRETPRSAAANG